MHRPPHPRPLPPGSTVEVTLVKRPRPDVRYPARVLRDDGVHLVVRAPWAGPADRDFGFVAFRSGDVFTEHFWRDRWYSVKEVRDAGGALKGWYCDVARPVVVRGGAVTCVDLDLDLWRSADGREVLRLDEDEFADAAWAGRDPVAARRALAALDELEGLARGDGLAALLTG